MPTGTCAYCGQRSALTREHIWPRCIIERAPAYVMRFSGKANKVFAGDLFVKDVCSACNNGALSALDSYACGLYDEYFCRIVNAEEEVVFRFDHDLLLRWLLKVSYNSALASASDVPFHLPLRHFMLGQSGKPEYVSAVLDIVIPSVVNGVTLEPRATRCARIQIGHARSWVCVRLVAVNSFYFYLVITGDKPVHVDAEELQEFRQGVRGLVLLPSGELVLRDHRSSFYEMHAPHLIQDRELYEEFMSIYRRPH